jgi:ketosteroid isomerase-like protein
MSQANVEIVRRWAEAWDRDDLCAFTGARFLDDDVRWFPTPQHPEETTIRGPAQVRAFLEEWVAPWDAYAVRAVAVIDAGDDRVVVITHHLGRQRGTDLEVDMTLPGVIELRAGKILSARWFLEEREAFEAAGLSE